MQVSSVTTSVSVSVPACLWLCLLLPPAASNTLKLEEDYPKPTPAPDEALIRVHRAGICATVGMAALASAGAAAEVAAAVMADG